MALLRASNGLKELCYDKLITKKRTPSISTAVNKFGNSSFNFISGFVGIGTSSEFVFTKNDDFTIENWQYIDAIASDCWFFANGSETTSCLKTYNGNLYLQTEGGFTSALATSIFKTKVWQHVALVQKDGVLKLYVDGVSKMTLTATANFGLATTVFTFGGGSSGLYSCNGYMDQLRISRIARYFSDFIPDNSPFIID